MKVGTHLMAASVTTTVQSWHEVGQLQQDIHSMSWKDHISTTENASAMRCGMRAAMRAPEVRAHLVDELRARIEAGRYEIDSLALAQKILNRSISEG